MNALCRFFLWYALLSKRLVRRGAYLAILALVPLFCAAILLFSRQDSGVVTVALFRAENGDEASRFAVERLLTSDSLVRFLPFDREEDARAAVERGAADAAWLFHADTTGQLALFARGQGGVAVTVVEREDNVFLMLSREKLFAVLYPQLSRSIFSHFLSEAPGSASYYDHSAMGQPILRFTTADGQLIREPNHYLVAPLRGILSLLLMLAGFASAMYCYREEQAGSFVWLSAGSRRLLPILCHLTAILPVAAAVYAAMALTGILTSPLWELLILALLSLAAALFCELIRTLVARAAVLGALLPPLMAAMVVLCPVFADLETLRSVSYLFPPSHYLHAVFSPGGAVILAGYTALLALLTLSAVYLRQRRA